MIKVSFWFNATYGHSTDISVDSILQEFRDVILSNVNARECAPELRWQRVIADGTETDIERAKGARKACGILYDHLCRHCTLEQIVVFFRVLMEVDGGYGRKRDVGQQLHTRIQESGTVAREKTVSPDVSKLHLSPPKAEVNIGNNFDLLYVDICSTMWCSFDFWVVIYQGISMQLNMRYLSL